MYSQDLIQQLFLAYSEKNLNTITTKIIELYKKNQFDSIREISKLVLGDQYPESEKISKSFSRLIMLFHPDKFKHYNSELTKAVNCNDIKKLDKLTGILLLNDIGNIKVVDNTIDEVEFASQYQWEGDEDGFDYFEDSDDQIDLSEDEETDYYKLDDEFNDQISNSFFSAVKRKYYGFMDVDLPTYYLEDIDNIEVAGYEIMNLDGIVYCKHVVILDLSDNQITDISELRTLELLEEINFSGNLITEIDVLSNLERLRVIDLSGNNITDISPLFGLRNLEYINLLGNNISYDQFEKLRENQVMVVY
ncbi:MAG: leucine-rich repeat domain-containing protein [Bacteroidetes bacterium]|nr:leucine-rich repeat domain-containing protein [Bacteroidota bacterium]